MEKVDLKKELKHLYQPSAKKLSMAIYGIGAYYDKDVSGDFIANNVACPGWSYNDAPELHQFINSIKVGGIVYIKSFSPSSSDIVVKGIGVVIDDQLVQSNLVGAGRNIRWLVTEHFRIPKPKEKN